MIAPGAIDTDLNAGWLRSERGKSTAMAATAIKRVGQPEDVADAASFLASDHGRWITGQRIEAASGAHL